MKCHPFDFAQDRSESEQSGGQEYSCFSSKILFNKNEILRRFAPQNDINQSRTHILSMTRQDSDKL